MICRRWHRTRILVAIITIGGFVVIRNVYDIIKNSQCSEEESNELLANLCAEYHHHNIHGNLCDALCTSKTMKYQKCTNYRQGKKVLFVLCDDVCKYEERVQAVLKTKLSKDYKILRLDIPRHKNGSVTKEGFEIAETIFKNKAFSDAHYHHTAEQSIFTDLWSMNFEEFVQNSPDPDADFIALQTIWSLINQDEYLFLRVNQHLPYIPSLYGTCGSFYALEYAPPEDISSPNLFQYKSLSWERRADIAIKLLDIAHSLAVDFYEPVHICDIKEENFGIGSDKTVKIIDLDSLFFHETMMRHLADPECSQHEDCDFFDCRGWCNEAGRCTRQRTNDNVQSICEDIFINKATNFYKGLLHDPPGDISKELSTLLYECAYPNKNIGEIVRQHIESDTYWKLHVLLSKHSNSQQ